MTTRQSSASADMVKELRDELRKAELTIKKQQVEIDMLSPTVDASRWIWETPEDVKAFFTEQQLKDIAEASFKEVNRERVRNGYQPITYSDEEWAEGVDQAIEDLLTDAAAGPPEVGPLARTLKMVNPKNGNLVQIPFEGQVNNIAGSLNDGLFRYEQKGFKRTKPMFCPSADCWQTAASGTGSKKGSYLFDGYCSQDHFNRTERRDNADLPGVTSRNEIIGRPSR